MRRISEERRICAKPITTDSNELWLANLMGEPRRVKLNATMSGRMGVLDAESFVAAAQHPDALDRLERPFAGDEFELDAYAVARLRSA
jgi:D-apionolactonase